MCSLQIFITKWPLGAKINIRECIWTLFKKAQQQYKAKPGKFTNSFTLGKVFKIVKETSGVCSFYRNFTERQILWSLCSVDFHTFTLQLPIQTLHSVVPELQVFVSSLNFSVKRAHPWDRKSQKIKALVPYRGLGL